MGTLVPVPHPVPLQKPSTGGTCSFECARVSLSVPTPAKNHRLSVRGCPRSPKLLLVSVNPVWVCIRGPAAPRAHGSGGGVPVGRVGPGVGDMPSRALTPSPSLRPGRLAVRYRMYRQVQLPWYRRAGPALQQRRRPHHCGCHQGKPIASHRRPPCREHPCIRLPCRWDPLVPLEVPQSQQGRNRAVRLVN